MARRSRDWNEGLAEDLRDKTFAREFLLAAIGEGVSIQVALGKVIRAMGVKEFAASVRMRPSSLPHHISFAIFLRRANSFSLGSALGNEPGRISPPGT